MKVKARKLLGKNGESSQLGASEGFLDRLQKAEII